MPGAACGNEALVKELAEELQARKIGRGNVGQIKEAELMKQEVALLHSKVGRPLLCLSLRSARAHVFSLARAPIRDHARARGLSPPNPTRSTSSCSTCRSSRRSPRR